ncbi:hypothetical protein TSTA_082350 [Talaromyces stipitatus ATCC 10500]|uniref:Secreted protein n=1 Tax=Talaromyces stipitatus (strain ATCC 10500 / CBS 375.48 / QM 6759 / NRRL 1006) TaxID=441959 RepID=B8M160_TALSN|nr:uncharacterized protein TSTA_082350 [Talaromyces stipitatus ATCC 10500]EED21002.1 hypothetical protein TSTA_082350 [Talaromyces stipitatus ATCC 10500]
MKSFKLSVLYALGLAVLALAGPDNYINLYDDRNCTIRSGPLPIFEKDACHNAPPGGKPVKAISGNVIKKGCNILAYEDAQCGGNSVKLTWADPNHCFTPSSDDASFQAFQLKDCN